MSLLVFVFCSLSSKLQGLYYGDVTTCTLTPGIAPPTGDLTVNIALSGSGSVSVASLHFTDTTPGRFTFTAASVTGNVLISFTLSGADAGAVPTPTSVSFSITPVPTAGARFTLTGLPFVWYTSQSISLALTPALSPSVGKVVVVTLTSSTGTVTPSQLTYGYTSGSAAQTITVTAPAIGTQIDLRAQISGSAANEFSAAGLNPWTFPLTAQSPIGVTGAPAQISPGDSFTLSFAPTAVPISGVTITVVPGGRAVVDSPANSVMFPGGNVLTFPSGLQSAQSLTI
jgi:hypothetical protein